MTPFAPNISINIVDEKPIDSPLKIQIHGHKTAKNGSIGHRKKKQ